MKLLLKILSVFIIAGCYNSFAQDVSKTLTDVEISIHHGRDDGEVTYSSGNLFPDFTYSDIDGQTHNLYDYLDQGYSVVLNYFTYWCQSCQDAGPSLDHFYNTYSVNNDLVKVIGFETSTLNSQNVAGIDIPSMLVNWGIEYPVINSDGLASIFSSYVEEYPTYIVICPDKSYNLESGYSAGATLPFLTQKSFACENTDIDDDLDLISLGSERCESSMTLNIQFQNTGTNDITNFNYIVYIDSLPIDTVNYVCSLSEGDVLITSSSYDNIPNGNIDVSVVADLGPSEDNSYNNSLNVQLAPTNMVYENDITVIVNGDDFPEETAWVLKNLDGTVMASDGFNMDGDIVGLSNSSYNQNIVLPAGQCYQFEIFDSYGDGICCGQGSGSYTIKETSTNSVLASGGDFAFLDQFTFHIAENLSLQEVTSANEKIILSEAYFDLLGRRLHNPPKNTLFLRMINFEDGSSTVEKIIME